jgi:hypothetical protein
VYDHCFQVTYASFVPSTGLPVGNLEAARFPQINKIIFSETILPEVSLTIGEIHTRENARMCRNQDGEDRST